MKKRPLPSESLAKNLRHLMDLRELSEGQLATKAKVSQKAINNILNGTSGGTLRVVDRLAKAFNLTAWHMIMPDLPDELISGGAVEKLYKAFISSDTKGRAYIQHVAERESTYKAQGNKK